MSTISFASCEENTSYRLCRKRKVLNNKEGEIITVPGCVFRVYRKRTAKNVYSCSFWIGAEEYSTTLINSLYWWANEFPKHVLYDKQWNVRLYIDGLVALDKPISTKAPDSTWKTMLEWLCTKAHLEIWLFECTAGYNKEKPSFSHVATFGSLLRMHALTDPTLETVCIRNIEGLTTSVDHQRLLQWKEMVQIKRAEQKEKNELFFSVMLMRFQKHHLVAQVDITREYKLGPEKDFLFSIDYPQMCACYFNVDMTLNHPATKWSEIMRIANLWHTHKINPDYDYYPIQFTPYEYGVDEYVLMRLFWKLFYLSPNSNVQFVKYHQSKEYEYLPFSEIKHIYEKKFANVKKPTNRLLKIDAKYLPSKMKNVDWLTVFRTEKSVMDHMLMDWSLKKTVRSRILSVIEEVKPKLVARLNGLIQELEFGIPEQFTLPGWSWKDKNNRKLSVFKERARIDFFNTKDFQTPLYPSISTSLPKKAKK